MSHERDLAEVKRLEALYARAQQSGKSRDWWRYNRMARELGMRLGVSEIPARPKQRVAA